MRAASGFPTKFVIIIICSCSVCAGSSGFLLISSAKMHPTLQTSMADVYYRQDKITSGALYQRVAM